MGLLPKPVTSARMVKDFPSLNSVPWGVSIVMSLAVWALAILMLSSKQIRANAKGKGRVNKT